MYPQKDGRLRASFEVISLIPLSEYASPARYISSSRTYRCMIAIPYYILT